MTSRIHAEVKELFDKKVSLDLVCEEIGFEIDQPAGDNSEHAEIYAGLSDITDKVERYLKIGKNWLNLNKGKLQAVICAGEWIADNEVETCVEIVTSLMEHLGYSEYLGIRVAYWILKSGIESYCRDYKSDVNN